MEGIRTAGCKMMKKRNGKKGFTLVELVVVIAILGVLAAIAIPSIIGIINAANESADKTTANTMNVACQDYYYLVTSGDINSTNKGSSTQANLPAAASSPKARETAAKNATVINALEYAGMTDVIARLKSGDKTFGFNSVGHIYVFDTGMTLITSTTTLGDMYK